MIDHYLMNDDGSVRKVDDLMEWARAWSGSRRDVAYHGVGSVSVSTVFLGIDHSFDRGRPLLFETMVFGGPLDGEQDRYTTRDEALTGHARMVARVFPT